MSQVASHVLDLQPEEIAAMVKRRDPVILELGAADGRDTERFLAAMPEARIRCFEPDPRCIQAFRERIGEDLRVSLYEIAISDKHGSIIFHASSGDMPPESWKADLPKHDWHFSGSICRPTGHLKFSPWVTFSRKIHVRTTSLDSWLCFHPTVSAIDLLWMDVQGAEGKVICGASETLTHTHYVYAEYAAPELYEGQLSLNGLAAALPDYELVGTYGFGGREGNALFRNTQWPDT